MENAVSPVIGIILLVGVTFAISTIVIYHISDIAEEPSKQVVSSYTIEQSEESVTINILRSKNIEKYVVVDIETSTVEYSTSDPIWSKKFKKRNSEIVIKAISKGTGAEQLITKIDPVELPPKSFDNSIVIGNGNFLKSNGKLADYSVDPLVIGSPDVLYGENSNKTLPFVNQNGDLAVANENGDYVRLVNNSEYGDPRTTKSYISASKWKGEKSIFYVSESKKIFKVNSSKDPQLVKNPNNGANAVVGTGDIDNDNMKELLFADGSQQLRYINKDMSVEVLNGGQLGSNNGIGSGNSIADFDRDGNLRVVIVDGSNNIKLVGDQQSDTTISVADSKKSPVKVFDYDDDSKREIFYTDLSTGNIKYVDDILTNRNIKTLKDSDGNPVKGDGSVGLG
jgi:hypothetical protein